MITEETPCAYIDLVAPDTELLPIGGGAWEMWRDIGEAEADAEEETRKA